MKIRLIIIILYFCHTSVKSNDLHVRNVDELYDAIHRATITPSIARIILKPGNYRLNRRLELNRDHLAIVGEGGPSKTIVSGNGMKKSTVTEVLFDVSASHISISGLTIRSTANHLIQVRAEKNADYFHLSNCVLQDAYEQLLKVSGAIKPKGLYSDYGIIEGCLFEYTGDVGPQFYIGGIDAHRSRHWLIQNNTFKNIASPKRHIAEHAIHFWNDSSDTIVRNNTILNSDRGIGFGLGNTTRQHQRGVVEGNLIIHTNRDHPFADTGIVLENSPGTVIRDNTILLYSGYPNAIEYRFTSTHGVIIEGNTVNKRITSRDGATATVTANQVVD